jgi:hypothetical protein
MAKERVAVGSFAGKERPMLCGRGRGPIRAKNCSSLDSRGRSAYAVPAELPTRPPHGYRAAMDAHGHTAPCLSRAAAPVSGLSKLMSQSITRAADGPSRHWQSNMSNVACFRKSAYPSRNTPCLYLLVSAKRSFAFFGGLNSADALT